MIRRLRRAILIVVYALAGAVGGRIAMDLRRRYARGEPLEVRLDAGMLRPQEIVPGLIAALRVRDQPWSYLHIPSWFAAFAVNFAISALGRELQPLAEASPDPADDAHTIVTTASDRPAASRSTEAGGGAAAGFTPFED